jgi:hypothetical protein
MTRVAKNGIFSNQKSFFGQILEGLAVKTFRIFYSHLVYFNAIWHIFWLFGIFFVLVCSTKKIWQPMFFADVRPARVCRLLASVEGLRGEARQRGHAEGDAQDQEIRAAHLQHSGQLFIFKK